MHECFFLANCHGCTDEIMMIGLDFTDDFESQEGKGVHEPKPGEANYTDFHECFSRNVAELNEVNARMLITSL